LPDEPPVGRAYLDHASATPLRPQVIDALTAWLAMPAADPGRLHREGHVVRAALEEARAAVAELCGVRPRQVIFTSGATEAALTATWSATCSRPGSPVACAPVERAVVREGTARWAPAIDLAVTASGRIDVASVVAALDAAPALVHCQWGNAEVGTLQPVHEIVAACREANVPVHVDASAALGHVPLRLDELGADFTSVDAHTVGGAPGVGALVLRRGTRITPLMVGAQQERGRRAGLENVPGIVAFGAAAGAVAVGDEASRAAAQIEALLRAAREVPGVNLVGEEDPGGRLPHILCMGIEGVEAEPVLLGLDRAGVAVHSGSACSTELFEPSPVLEAMGVDASRSLRLSVGWSTTDADVEAFRAAFPGVVDGLRSLAGH